MSKPYVEYVENIAKKCHEANKAYCEFIGDMSQPSWDDAPDWQKESAIKGVMYHLENEDSKPEDSHNSWLSEKVIDGWQYGEVKDPVKKTHPCFVPYVELPFEQRVKDFIFMTVIEVLK